MILEKSTKLSNLPKNNISIKLNFIFLYNK